MLFDAIKKMLFQRVKQHNPEEQKISLERVEAIKSGGDFRTAIKEYRKHLERFPYDLHAINNLGVCLSDLGDEDAGAAQFELAFSLDETFQPAIVNYARYFQCKRRTKECLTYLRHAKTIKPDNRSIDVVFAGVAMSQGDAETAKRYGLKAWLSHFDDLRPANCFLFYCSYAGIDEALLAAEHRFWAETLLPLPASVKTISTLSSEDEVHKNTIFAALPTKGKKIRIAYWSPDFRDHSVRYFALPLLENHDRDLFEIIGYHDAPLKEDLQTDAIKECCDYFIYVNEMPDMQLVDLMRSHQIDILVELAGQSGANRLNLLQERLATHQLTGIGYPPTTGLSSIDGKFLDPHIVTEDSSRYYTEAPFVLDGSFWCFDPKVQPEICLEPPAIKNGYITFACAGNIAKITQPIMDCWVKILNRVPDSRLLMRSISFEDEAALEFIASRFQLSGMDMTRVEFLGPARGAEFFASYNNVDIILDTFPFNGGTTTCFATYMGVPVLSMAGRSLLSRMGKSILSNLGLSNWVVTNYEDYVEKAILHAQDIGGLSHFRAEARNLYAASALGNGKLFARDFEKRCFELMKQTEKPPKHQVAALPAEEIVSRVYAVMRYGYFEAAQRIIDHCLREYPDCGAAHILNTYKLTKQGKFVQAIEYLEARLASFSLADKFTALLNIARFNILANQSSAVEYAIKQMTVCVSDSPKDQLYLRMFQAYLDVIKSADNDEALLAKKSPAAKGHFIVLIVCDDQERYVKLKESMQETCKKTDGINVTYKQCSENNRWRSYRDALQDKNHDFVLIVQNYMDICNVNFFADVACALEKYDIISVGGARNWDRLDWRLGPAENRVMSFLIPSGEADGFYEVSYSSDALASLVGSMVVLDGSFLAIKTSGVRTLDVSSLFDPMLEGGGIFQEEYFTNAAFRAGLSLGVHQNLGVILDWQIPLEYTHVEEVREHITQKMSFDPFIEDGESGVVFSMPLPLAEQGIKVLQRFLE
jgi:predicted O-linked N-acetylglucosamine transferase (SPINDLY family)